MPCYDKFNPTITINRKCPNEVKKLNSRFLGTFLKSWDQMNFSFLVPPSRIRQIDMDPCQKQRKNK